MLAGSNLYQLRVAPPTTRMAALSGDLDVAGNLSVFPAARGNLDLFAYDDLRLGEILISDADPELLPSIGRPARDLGPTLGRVFARIQCCDSRAFGGSHSLAIRGAYW